MSSTFPRMPCRPTPCISFPPARSISDDSPSRCEGYVLVFMEDFLLYPGSFSGNIYELSFFHTVGEKPVLRLNPPEAARIRSYMSAIAEEYQASASDRIPVLRAHLYILMVNIQRLYTARYPGQNSAKGFSFVRKFKHLVSTHCIQQTALDTYAAKDECQPGTSEQHDQGIDRAIAGTDHKAGSRIGGQTSTGPHGSHRSRGGIPAELRGPFILRSLLQKGNRSESDHLSGTDSRPISGYCAKGIIGTMVMQPCR